MSRWASRVNDNSLEWLVALVRVISVLCAAGFFAFAFVVFWATSDHVRSAATASWIVCLAMAVGLGWWSWYQQGNREWARPVVCEARYNDLQCNVAVGPIGEAGRLHEGPHWDSVRDPKRGRTWS